jgi:hypothetical protein
MAGAMRRPLQRAEDTTAVATSAASISPLLLRNGEESRYDCYTALSSSHAPNHASSRRTNSRAIIPTWWLMPGLSGRLTTAGPSGKVPSSTGSISSPPVQRRPPGKSKGLCWVIEVVDIDRDLPCPVGLPLIDMNGLSRQVYRLACCPVCLGCRPGGPCKCPIANYL